MLRDALCIVGAAEEGSSSLLQGLAISGGYDLAPTYMAVVPGPPPITNILGSDFVEDLVQEAKARAKESAEQVRARIFEKVRRAGKEANVVLETRSLAEAAAEIERFSRSFDLTIVERPQSFASISSAIFETVLFQTGRPALIAVPSVAPERFERVVLAWDGSVYATRALAAMLALFPSIDEIAVLTVVGEKNLDDVSPGAEIAAHIRRHNIQATVTCIDHEQFAENAGPAIAKFAKQKGAELIAMGGYGHSRLREFLLGGVTEYLSRNTSIPLLLVH